MLIFLKDRHQRKEKHRSRQKTKETDTPQKNKLLKIKIEKLEVPVFSEHSEFPLSSLALLLKIECLV